MKKITSLVLLFIITLSCFHLNIFANDRSKNVRGAWITTVYNSDFPSKESFGNIEQQKNEFIYILDKLKDAKINTAVVQVRPKADALYKSNINPWSEYLTGEQGKDPGYDPLEFMIEETHKRNMEFHAWLNPYRVTTSGTDLNVLSENHIARLHPEWVIEHKSALYLNPEIPEVKEHIKNTVAEIVENYDVDAIHFDDYFYPSDYPLPEGETRDGEVANHRRQNVNEMVKMVYDTIKSIDDNIKFGISPTGIWKNISSDPTGSNTKGYEHYYSVFSDVREWIKTGIVDYIVPQIYWEIGNKAADYETLVKWWNNEVEGTDVDLYIGQALYKDEVASQIDEQIAINGKYNNVKGSIFFSTRDILDNRKDSTNKLKNVYSSIDDSENIVSDEKISEVENNNSLVTSKLLENTVIIDGSETKLESYNINGYNYFNLRNLAFKLRDKKSQFNVEWNNDKSAINIALNSRYIGNEQLYTTDDNQIATLSNDILYINNVPTSVETYKILDNNFYKLRDLAEHLNFDVEWKDGIIYINSK